MILVVDHAHSAVCGIHDLGLRIVDNLARACLDVTHADCDSAETYLGSVALADPDTVIVNYRPDLMPWIPKVTHRIGRSQLAVLHNFDPSTLDRNVYSMLAWFDGVLVLDQTMSPSDPRAIVTHRPIPDTVPHVERRHGPPQIGSFGFAFPHKRFDTVAAECASLGHDAVFNLHMPEAFFNGAGGAPIYTDGILRACQQAIRATPVAMHYSHDVVAERELVARLARNDVNALLYEPGQPDAGISSALDYLIAARRPILVSDAFMFHHVHDHVAVYPQTRLADVLDDYDTWQRHADALYNDTAGRFAADLDGIL